MKTVYICGDSFAVADPEYHVDYWVSRLEQQLFPTANVINLGRICASNLQISLQVDAALKHGADYIVYLATSSARDDIQFRPNQQSSSLLDRYVDLTNPDNTSDLTSVSLSYLQNSNVFDTNQINFLKKYLLEYQPIDLAVYKNQLFIEATLYKLQCSGTPFIFDKGGFEHSSFCGTNTQYFTEYSKYFSQYNLWDFVDPGMPLRPYYHITDPAVHQKVADYYSKKILECI
jgi:hypothetical protein